MNLPLYQDLRESAHRSLDAAQNPKRIILIHTGVVVLVSLALMLADYLLEQQIGSTGGLGGLGTRSVLETIRAVLQIAQLIILPFWQMGYLYYTLKLAQGEDVGTAGLTEGFRRFGPILRLKIMMGVVLFPAVIASYYLASVIFMFTPWSAPLLEIFEPMMNGTMEPDAMLELYQTMPPETITSLMVIFVICLVALLIPIYYRYRMAELWLLDHPGHGALASMFFSRKMMKGNCMAVFKIDLHFWWFFLMDLGVTILLYGDMLLNSFGISLPISSDLAFYLFFVLYLVAQLGLSYWRQNEVSVSYAHLYESLKPTEEEPRPTP